MTVLMLVELDDDAPSALTRVAVGLVPAALELVALLPSDASPLAASRLRSLGVDRVLRLEEPSASIDSAALAAQVAPLLTGAGVRALVAPPTHLFRETVGRLAVRLSSPLVGGAVAMEDDESVLIVDASIDGGRRRSRSRVRPPPPPVLILASPDGKAAGRPPERRAPETADATVSREPSHIRPVARLDFAPAAPTLAAGLAAARVVVAGGRGMGSPEALERLRRWSRGIGAEFGSSRAPVESEWADFSTLIGQTGTSIEPDLYLAFGISGAPQHMAGVRGSRTIVAVNIDASAPIMAEADVAIVADAGTVLDELLALD